MEDNNVLKTILKFVHIDTKQDAILHCYRSIVTQEEINLLTNLFGLKQEDFKFYSDYLSSFISLELKEVPEDKLYEYFFYNHNQNREYLVSQCMKTQIKLPDKIKTEFPEYTFYRTLTVQENKRKALKRKLLEVQDLQEKTYDALTLLEGKFESINVKQNIQPIPVNKTSTVTLAKIVPVVKAVTNSNKVNLSNILSRNKLENIDIPIEKIFSSGPTLDSLASVFGKKHITQVFSFTKSNAKMERLASFLRVVDCTYLMLIRLNTGEIFCIRFSSPLSSNGDISIDKEYSVISIVSTNGETSQVFKAKTQFCMQVKQDTLYLNGLCWLTETRSVGFYGEDYPFSDYFEASVLTSRVIFSKLTSPQKANFKDIVLYKTM